MIPVFALYCAEHSGRQRKSDAHYRERGLNPTWFRGMHGTSWGIATTRYWELDRCTIGPKSVAMMIGHYFLWQHIWLAGHEVALILEDDAVLCADFAVELQRLVERLPNDWQFVFVGSTGVEIPAKITEDFGGGLYRVYYPFGTFCYLVRRSALPILLDRMAEARGPIDLQLYQNVLQTHNRLQWYVVGPPMAHDRTVGGEWVPSS